MGLSHKKHTMPAGLTAVPPESQRKQVLTINYTCLYSLSTKTGTVWLKAPSLQNTHQSEHSKTSIPRSGQGLSQSKRQTRYWEYARLEQLRPAKLTLFCTDGWYTSSHLVILGMEPRVNLDIFVDPPTQSYPA